MAECVQRILLVEDNPGDADLLAELLGESEDVVFDLACVPRLGDALNTLRREQFDAVLVDLSLPDSSGLETFFGLRAADAEVPILILTGRDDIGLSREAVRHGAQDFLVKGKVNGDSLARAVGYAIERQRLLREAGTTALMDELTGLYNRRGLQAVGGPLFRGLGRLKKGLMLLYLDLDNMKPINDAHGHEAGDQALRDVAELLRSTFRESDILARLGGDEFAVLAAGAAVDSAGLMEQRLRDNLADFNRRSERPYELALSVGAAHCGPDRPATLQALLSRADGLMYEQKQARRRGRGAPHMTRSYGELAG
jgi:two-component system, cell cycle response regulator